MPDNRIAWSVVCVGCEEPPASQFAQRSEVIYLPGSSRRAGAPARAPALSDWLSFLMPRPCAGEAAVTYHKSMLRTGTTDPGRIHRIGVTNDGAENPPRLRVTNGEDSQESAPPVKRSGSREALLPPCPLRTVRETSRFIRLKPFATSLARRSLIHQFFFRVWICR
jgi:hypothetical protein